MSEFVEVITVLDLQNEVKEIATTDNETGEIAVKFDGDFSAGDVELGYTDTNTSAGTFISSFSSSVLSDVTYKIGRNQIMYARATGATPDINVKTTPVA